MSLRNKTGLPMMECKEALVEAKRRPREGRGDPPQELKGKMEAKGRPRRRRGPHRDRHTATAAASIIELRAETDFTAKNEKFVAADQKIADAALKAARRRATAPAGAEAAAIDDIRISTGENISCARGHKLIRRPRHGLRLVRPPRRQDRRARAGRGRHLRATLREICMHITAAVPSPRASPPTTSPPTSSRRSGSSASTRRWNPASPRRSPRRWSRVACASSSRRSLSSSSPTSWTRPRRSRTSSGKAKIVAFLRWAVGEQA